MTYAFPNFNGTAMVMDIISHLTRHGVIYHFKPMELPYIIRNMLIAPVLSGTWNVSDKYHIISQENHMNPQMTVS